MSLFLRNLKKANESSISFIDYHCKVSRAMVFFLGRGQNVLWATRKYMRLLQKCKHDKVRYSVNRNLRNENTYFFFSEQITSDMSMMKFHSVGWLWLTNTLTN